MFSNYFGVIKATYKKGLVYRVDNLLSTVNRIVEVAVFVFIWSAIYQNQEAINGMSLSQIIIYYALAYSLGHVMTWGINKYMSDSIKKGRIDMELLYPIDYMKYFFCYKIGMVLRQFIIISVPSFILLILLFHIHLSFTFINIFLFFVITILSIVTVFFIEFIFGLMTFYTKSGWGLQVLKKSLVVIFSGQIAPIEFFPEIIGKCIQMLPFIDFIYSPITTLLGMNSWSAIGIILVRQVVWIAILYIASKLIYREAIKNVIIYGG